MSADRLLQTIRPFACHGPASSGKDTDGRARLPSVAPRTPLPARDAQIICDPTRDEHRSIVHPDRWSCTRLASPVPQRSARHQQ